MQTLANNQQAARALCLRVVHAKLITSHISFSGARDDVHKYAHIYFHAMRSLAGPPVRRRRR